MSSVYSRREFLTTAATGVAAATLCSRLPAAEADPYGGFKMGIQSYSLRHFKVKEALEISKKLGLKYWESYRDHIAVSAVPKAVAENKELVAAHGVKLLAFGVVGFDANESNARQLFEFAKAMGIESLSADPNKDKATFDLLDKLTEEYKVNIAIHNHGPGAKYDKISDVVTWVKDRAPRVGACVDTGHYLRSSESPVEALQRLKGRVFGVHLKDVKDTNKFKIVGEGDLDVLGCLKELKAQNYQHCLALEYEENAENPVPDLEICLQNVRAAVKKL